MKSRSIQLGLISSVIFSLDNSMQEEIEAHVTGYWCYFALGKVV